MLLVLLVAFTRVNRSLFAFFPSRDGDTRSLPLTHHCWKEGLRREPNGFYSPEANNGEEAKREIWLKGVTEAGVEAWEEEESPLLFSAEGEGRRFSPALATAWKSLPCGSSVSHTEESSSGGTRLNWHELWRMPGAPLPATPTNQDEQLLNLPLHAADTEMMRVGREREEGGLPRHSRPSLSVVVVVQTLFSQGGGLTLLCHPWATVDSP